MNETEFQKLQETIWQRALTADEQAALDGYLAAHPPARLQWDEAMALEQLLGKLPDAPVSTNFTSRVMQAVERESAVKTRSRENGLIYWLRSNWLPRIAATALLVFVGVISVQQYKRTQIANDIAAVTQAATVPPQWLEDFDAINRLSQPPVDHELLAALE